MTEMRESGFMDIIRDISCDNHPYSTKLYVYGNYYINLFKETIIPDKAFRISFSSCTLYTQTQKVSFTTLGIYWKPTHILDYVDFAAQSAVEDIEKETLDTPESKKIEKYIADNTYAAFVQVQISILKRICSSLFYKNEPIIEEWDFTVMYQGDQDGKVDINDNSVVFLLEKLVNHEIDDHDIDFADILELLAVRGRNNIKFCDFPASDIMLYRYGTSKEQGTAITHMIQQIMDTKRSEAFGYIWNLHKIWERAYQCYDSLLEKDIDAYKKLKQFGDSFQHKVVLTLEKKNGSSFSYTSYNLNGLVYPYGIYVHGEDVFPFDKIIAIKGGNKTIYKRGEKK